MNRQIGNASSCFLPEIRVDVSSSGTRHNDIKTLESLLAQDYLGKLQITLQVDRGCAYQNAFLQVPWLSNVCVIEKNNDMPEVMDWHLPLQGGDELHPSAVRQMVRAILESGSDLACAAVRYFLGERRWAMRSSLCFFDLPSTVPFSPFLDRYILFGGGIALYKQKGNEKKKLCSIVHEYLCQRETDSENGADLVLEAPKTSFLTWEKPQLSWRDEKRQQVAGKKPFVWLFGERAGQSAEENSWILFNFCQEKYPNVESYYVLNPDARVSEEVRFHPSVIYKGDNRWQSLIPRATHFFFNDSAMDILQDRSQLSLASSAEKIFLTHGVLYYSSGVYVRNHRYFDQICVGLNADLFCGARDWRYPLGTFVETGLPRWDRLTQTRKEKKEILLCPTWRKRLDEQMWKKWHPEHQSLEDVVENDRFFEHYLSFLKSPKLAAFLEKNDLYLTVAVHFRLRLLFDNLLEGFSDRIQFHDDERNIQQLLIDSCLLITDYSSIMWDMAYMEKPVICWQFDKAWKLWENEMEHFNLGDNDFFADVCYSRKEVFTALEKYHDHDFCLNEDQKKELATLFPARGNHCQKVMDAVLNPFSSPEPASRSFLFPLEDNALSEFCSGKKVACIGNPSFLDYLPVHFLSPETWQSELVEKKPDLLLFQPHLNASDSWSDYFFSLASTQAFMKELAGVLEKNRIPGYYLKSSFQYPHANIQGLDFFLPLQQQPVNQSEIYDISVIIPVYNCHEYLSDCVHSVLGQVINGSVEVILVNDGSPDNSQQLIDSFAAEYPNIKSVQQPNMRQGVARNHGLQVAQGRYVTFLDSDDRLAPDALASLHATILRHSAPVAVGQVCSVNVSGQRRWINQSGYHYLKAPEVISAQKWPSVFLDPSSVGKLYDREFLLKNNIFFSQSYWEDGFFCVSLFLKAQKIAVCHAIVYEYVGRPAVGQKSGTQTFSQEKLSQILKVSRCCLELAEKEPYEQHDMIIRLMVIRLDRFLYKFISSDNSLTLDCYMLLHNILLHIPNVSLQRYARYCGKLFELVATNRDGVEELTPDLLEDKGRCVYYDFYRPYVLPIKKEKRIFSFKYELGLIFVNIAKKEHGARKNCLKKIAQLAYRVVKYRGLKVKDSHNELASDYSFEMIHETAAYRLGDLLVESVRAPWKMLVFPQRVWSLWGEYKS